MNENLASISFWEYKNEEIEFVKVNDDNPVKRWINEQIKFGNGSCLEIGCFPGRYLTIFGDLGYQLNGIDLLDKTDTELPVWLKREGYIVGDFIKDDFIAHDFNEKKYDIVYSLGFIEHFTNWEEVVVKHIQLVKPGGKLIIEVPNFRGYIQYFLHFIFDRENLRRHFVPSMDPDKWEKLLLREGFEIEKKEFFYGFDFWVEEQKRNRVMIFLLNFFHKVVWKVKPFIKGNSKHYSPFCGIVARKL